MQSRSEQERTGQRKPEEQQGKANPSKAISTTRRVDHPTSRPGNLPSDPSDGSSWSAELHTEGGTSIRRALVDRPVSFQVTAELCGSIEWNDRVQIPTRTSRDSPYSVLRTEYIRRYSVLLPYRS